MSEWAERAALAYRPRDGGLQGQVLAFFAANEGEELTSQDVALKWDVRPASTVGGSLHRLVAMRLLAKRESAGPGRRYTVLSAGPLLAEWAARQVAQAENRPLYDRIQAEKRADAGVVPVGALEIRVRLWVHGAGTKFQRVEVAGWSRERAEGTARRRHESKIQEPTTTKGI